MTKIGVSITIDKNLIKKIDKEAEKKERSRSYIINEILEKNLKNGN